MQDPFEPAPNLTSKVNLRTTGDFVWRKPTGGTVEGFEWTLTSGAILNSKPLAVLVQDPTETILVALNDPVLLPYCAEPVQLVPVAMLYKWRIHAPWVIDLPQPPMIAEETEAPEGSTNPEAEDEAEEAAQDTDAGRMEAAGEDPQAAL